ncbi:MFS transporter [Nocardioides sp. 1609]|uniref:MFS transporter n=1 Tax=Nocardioides sp. 1609 TaxID=2508327 RepID=UPI001430CAFD|nr:MFS transporter [Nocardioides sp. 1609]
MDRFDGWRVVALLAAILTIGVGITFYGLSVYLSALTRDDDGFTLTTVSVATGAFLVVAGVAGIPVGRLLERYDARAVLVGGLVASAVAVLAVGQVRDPAQLVAAYAVLGVGFAAISVIPVSRVLAAWFVRRRARAMSVAFLGLPVGGAVVTPVVAALVERHGVAGASPFLAAALLLVAVPLCLLVQPDPARVGQRADGAAPASDPGAGAGPATGVPLAEAVRTPWFVTVTVALTLGMLSQLGALSHLYNAVAETSGVSTAAAVVSLLAAASLGGRIAGTWVFERVALAHATVALLLLQSGALVCFAVAPGRAAVLAATVAFGVSMGNMQVLQPLLIAERFGTRDFSRILARGNLAVMLGMAAGPVLVGVLHDATGGYPTAYVAAALPALLGAALMAWAARSPARTDLA